MAKVGVDFPVQVACKSNRGSWVLCDRMLNGKTVLITGANTGIGLETAVDLARRQAKVIIACRNSKKGEEAVEQIKHRAGSQHISYYKLDLASFDSIHAFVDEFLREETRLDILINNAGVMMCPKSTTEDGYETHLGVNHLGHFLLTLLLLDLMKRSAPSRIVTISSVMHTRMYNAYIHWDDINLDRCYKPRDAYSQSKLMNVLFSRELSKRLRGTGVTTYCVHPGLVRTNILHQFNHATSCWELLFSCVSKVSRFAWKSPEHGAQTSIYCAIAPELEKESGFYYCDCKRKREARRGRDDIAAERLWKISCEMTGIKDPLL